MAAGYSLDIVKASLNNPEIVNIQRGMVQINIGNTEAVEVLAAFDPTKSVLVNMGHYSTSLVPGERLATLEIVDGVTVKGKQGLAAAASATQIFYILIEFGRRVKQVYFHEASLLAGASNEQWNPSAAALSKKIFFSAGSRNNSALAAFTDILGRIRWATDVWLFSERDTTVGDTVMNMFVAEMD